jgi:pyridoxamine 5'-phosphate oxidase
MDYVTKDIAALREDYRQATLEIDEVAESPIQQFELWFQMAVNAKLKEPNAMVLATANAQGRPSARVVLLKGFDESGFVFYTNYESRKAEEMEENPYSALVFNWLELEKQVRIEGSIEKIGESIATAYFQSRPKGSQIGAWASPQSQVIPNRAILEQKTAELEKIYQDSEVLPKPKHWGGYLLRPNMIEFWQGRSSRLHDRIRYSLPVDGTWKIERLAP